MQNFLRDWKPVLVMELTEDLRVTAFYHLLKGRLPQRKFEVAKVDRKIKIAAAI